MKLRPFFGFYGGKWRAAARYPAPVHDTIVEPFAGSAGYALRHPEKRVLLADLDPVICGIWDYLLRVSAEEILSTPDIPPGGCVDDLHLCAEAAGLVGMWLNRGVASPRKSPSAWMRQGLRPGSFWGERVRRTISSQLEHIRHWKIENSSYMSMSGIGLEATWFIDPPYQKRGTHYRHGSAGINYHELAGFCRRRSGQVIVCEQAGATWLPFEPLDSRKTTRRGERSLEVMWTPTNPHPPGTGEHDFWNDEHPPCDQCGQPITDQRGHGPINMGSMGEYDVDEVHVFCGDECQTDFYEHEREARDQWRDDRIAIGRGIRSST